MSPIIPPVFCLLFLLVSCLLSSPLFSLHPSSLLRSCYLVCIFFFLCYLLSGRKTAIWGPADTNFHHESETHTHARSHTHPHTRHIASHPALSNKALNTISHHLLIPPSLSIICRFHLPPSFLLFLLFFFLFCILSFLPLFIGWYTFPTFLHPSLPFPLPQSIHLTIHLQ